MVKEVDKLGMRLGKYELGKTLGEGNFAKVKYAQNLESGQIFAVKILEKKKIINLKVNDQIKNEIGTLKLLKHPNVVRLHEVLASKTKIYMVLEYVGGGELFDRIATKGRVSEAVGRKLFQQLIDGVSYCHSKGVYHRDLKLENVLVDAKGNVKITDFGLSALPKHFREDGLLHTTCGSPNYVAPEILANRGYDGATSDVWSCGVILYVTLCGYLPFDDRNLAVLYQKIFKGETQMPKWLSDGAKSLLRRILDPNPITRITIAEIKEHEWFIQDHIPAIPLDEEENINIDAEAFSIKEAQMDKDKQSGSPTQMNAFQLIGMSSCLDLSGFLRKRYDIRLFMPLLWTMHEHVQVALRSKIDMAFSYDLQDASERKIRFTSNYGSKDLLEKIEDIVTKMGFQVQKRNGKLKVSQEHKGQKNHTSLSVATEMFEISPSLHVVELSKSHGDSSLYRQMCTKLSNDLELLKAKPSLCPKTY
ncbi:hypothetical protein MKW92_045455 [Papaver armeniacum]|nr:hypothetical protein MKW92_045455 [Papaver armeniacum]